MLLLIYHRCANHQKYGVMIQGFLSPMVRADLRDLSSTVSYTSKRISCTIRFTLLLGSEDTLRTRGRPQTRPQPSWGSFRCSCPRAAPCWPRAAWAGGSRRRGRRAPPPCPPPPAPSGDRSWGLLRCRLESWRPSPGPESPAFWEIISYRQGFGGKKIITNNFGK